MPTFRITCYELTRVTWIVPAKDAEEALEKFRDDAEDCEYEDDECEDASEYQLPDPTVEKVDD